MTTLPRFAPSHDGGDATETALAADHPIDWWRRPGLDVVAGRLAIAGRDAEALAREHGVPLFVYDITHMEERVRAMQAAMARTGFPWKVRWALKAQRQPEVLARLRSIGEPGSPEFVGLDVCSPREVQHAVAHGWPVSEISYTGTNVSDADLDVILEHGVHMNLDLLSQIERYGRRARGGGIGIRVNPRVSAARPDSGISYYSGEQADQVRHLPRAARRRGRARPVTRAHDRHDPLPRRAPPLRRGPAGVRPRRRRGSRHGAACPGGRLSIVEVNAGGGLAAPMTQGQRSSTSTPTRGSWRSTWDRSA